MQKQKRKLSNGVNVGRVAVIPALAGAAVEIFAVKLLKPERNDYATMKAAEAKRARRAARK